MPNSWSILEYECQKLKTTANMNEIHCPILSYPIFLICIQFEYGSVAFKTMSDVSNIRHVNLYLQDLGLTTIFFRFTTSTCPPNICHKLWDHLILFVCSQKMTGSWEIFSWATGFLVWFFFCIFKTFNNGDFVNTSN